LIFETSRQRNAGLGVFSGTPWELRAGPSPLDELEELQLCRGRIGQVATNGGSVQLGPTLGCSDLTRICHSGTIGRTCQVSPAQHHYFRKRIFPRVPDWQRILGPVLGRLRVPKPLSGERADSPCIALRSIAVGITRRVDGFYLFGPGVARYLESSMLATDRGMSRS